MTEDTTQSQDGAAQDATLLTGSDTDTAPQTPPQTAQDTGTQTPQDAAPQTAPQTAKDPEAANEAADAPPAAKAPEVYEFKAPETGEPLDAQVLDTYKQAARELDLTQEQAQTLIDRVAPIMQERQRSHIAETVQTWADTAQADQEFGGDALHENLATAKKAMDAFATPELKDLLTQSGLGNHPEVIRLFYRTGKAISEDRLLPSGNTSTDIPDARRLFAASNMNP